MKTILAILTTLILTGCKPVATSPPPATITPEDLRAAISSLPKPDAPVVNVDLEPVTTELRSLKKQLADARQVQSVARSIKTSSGWTGCLVHLAPNCGPCVVFKDDANTHVERHMADEGNQWSFGIGEQYHFNYRYHATLDEELPKFEFVRDGVVYHTVVGYHKGDLYKTGGLLDLHPNCDHDGKRHAARAAKYQSVERSSATAYRSNGSTGGSYRGSGRARVAGELPDGTVYFDADDDTTVGEIKAAKAQDDYEQQMAEYRLQRAVNRAYREQQVYQTYQYQAAYPAYGTVYQSYGPVRGVRCFNGVCVPY